MKNPSTAWLQSVCNWGFTYPGVTSRIYLFNAALPRTVSFDDPYIANTLQALASCFGYFTSAVGAAPLLPISGTSFTATADKRKYTLRNVAISSTGLSWTSVNAGANPVNTFAIVYDDADTSGAHAVLAGSVGLASSGADLILNTVTAQPTTIVNFDLTFTGLAS